MKEFVANRCMDTAWLGCTDGIHEDGGCRVAYLTWTHSAKDPKEDGIVHETNSIQWDQEAFIFLKQSYSWFMYIWVINRKDIIQDGKKYIGDPDYNEEIIEIDFWNHSCKEYYWG